MPLTLTCPACNGPQTVPDAELGQTIRCQACQAEFPAGSGAATAARTNPPPRRSFTPLVLSLLVLVGAGLVVYFVFGTSKPTDWADPDEVCTARFPNPPKTLRLSTANPAALKWGEQVTQATSHGRDYSVAILDGLNSGDQEVGPAARDDQMRAVLVVAAVNASGETILQRSATHEGRVAQEVVFANKEDDSLTAMRAVAGEGHVVRMAISGSGDRDKADAFLNEAAGFFDTVHLGPTFGAPILEDPMVVSAAELGAAYRADAKAADAKYHGKWLRVTGPVKAIAADGNTIELDAGASVVVVQRAVHGRMSVPVRKGSATVTATGKCQGPEDPPSGRGPTVVLTDATVLRPPFAK